MKRRKDQIFLYVKVFISDSQNYLYSDQHTILEKKIHFSRTPCIINYKRKLYIDVFKFEKVFNSSAHNNLENPEQGISR